jgi:hypothetical protein
MPAVLQAAAAAAALLLLWLWLRLLLVVSIAGRLAKQSSWPLPELRQLLLLRLLWPLLLLLLLLRLLLRLRLAATVKGWGQGQRQRCCAIAGICSRVSSLQKRHRNKQRILQDVHVRVV